MTNIVMYEVFTSSFLVEMKVTNCRLVGMIFKARLANESRLQFSASDAIRVIVW